MPRKGDRREKPIAGNPADPYGMHVLLKRYFQSLVVRNYSPETIQKHRLQLNDFIRWCAERELTQPQQITRHDLQAYQRFLVHGTDKRGQPYSHRNQYGRICSIRCWYKHLVREELVPHNPAADLDLPRLGSRLPKHVLSAAEAESVLSEPDVTTILGLRDRAMLETFYSTGIRRMELVHLQVHDLDMDRRVVTIRQGKRKKDRVVPIGGRALAWIEKYLEQVRPALEVDLHNRALFLTAMGHEFSGSTLSKLVREYVLASGIGKTGSCHLFRHTMATLMLEGGADIRYIQAMLGHENLETTQVYTRVSIRKLQEVHAASHPAKHGPPLRLDNPRDERL